MKVVHVSKENEPIKFSDCLLKAKKCERDGEIDEAIKMYEKCIRLNPKKEFAYTRLMILYRREKMYRRELAVIKQGIAFFDAFFIKNRKVKSNTRVKKLSDVFSKSTGLADQRGKIVIELQPILKWKQRMMVVQKLISKTAKL